LFVYYFRFGQTAKRKLLGRIDAAGFLQAADAFSVGLTYSNKELLLQKCADVLNV